MRTRDVLARLLLVVNSRVNYAIEVYNMTEEEIKDVEKEMDQYMSEINYPGMHCHLYAKTVGSKERLFMDIVYEGIPFLKTMFTVRYRVFFALHIPNYYGKGFNKKMEWKPFEELIPETKKILVS